MIRTLVHLNFMIVNQHILSFMFGPLEPPVYSARIYKMLQVVMVGLP